MTFSRRKIVAAAAGLVGSLAGCAGGSGGGGDGGGGDEATATETETPEPTATATATATPEVEPGTVVQWVYEGIGSHSVTSLSPSSSESDRTAWNPDVASDWEMNEDLTSEPVSHYFPEPGVYEYKCSYDFGHIGGCAAVVVGDQDYDQEMLPCEPQ